MRRGLYFNRKMAWRHARRKRRIAKMVYASWHDESDWEYYDNLHQFSKNKIHCSCPMCSAKTRNKGKRRYKSGNYMRHINYKVSELKRQISMDDEEFEYTGSSGNNSKRKNDW